MTWNPGNIILEHFQIIGFVFTKTVLYSNDDSALYLLYLDHTVNYHGKQIRAPVGLSVWKLASYPKQNMSYFKFHAMP